MTKLITNFISINILLLSTAMAFAEPSLRCEGNVTRMKSHTIVVIELEKTGYSVRYPELSNTKIDIQKLYSSEKFISFGVFGDMGIGIWYLNKENSKYAYSQMKDISWTGEPDFFNHDNYIGNCYLLSGKMNDFF